MHASMICEPVRYGFEPEDQWQEGAIGVFVANRQRPGDRDFGRSRARQRIAKWRQKESRWNTIHVSIMEHDKPAALRMFDEILVREILDMLPSGLRAEVLEGLVTNDGRRLRKAGRLIRETVPSLLDD